MSHTNSTTNYNLPQFVPSDKPAWLTDINAAFSDIDGTMKNNADAAAAAQGDATQALTDAATADGKATTADAKGAGAVASIEVAFDPTTIYAVGALVMYNSLLYRCTVAVITPGPWTGSANWERVTVDSMIPRSAQDIPTAPGSNVSVNEYLTTLTNNKANFISVVTKGGQVSIPASSDASLTLNVSEVGYNAIGVVSQATDTPNMVITATFINSPTEIAVRVKNLAPAALNNRNIYLNVLYQRIV